MTANLYCYPDQLRQLRAFVLSNHLRPGDAIIIKQYNKGVFLNLLDHYVLYLGDDYFMANYQAGTRILTCPEIYQFLPSMRVDRIRRFTGSEQERRNAVQRALAHKDRRSYHLIANNCEHFANDVQFGVSSSDQVLIGGTAAILTGTMLLTSTNQLLQGIGGIMTIIGGAAAIVEIASRNSSAARVYSK